VSKPKNYPCISCNMIFASCATARCCTAWAGVIVHSIRYLVQHRGISSEFTRLSDASWRSKLKEKSVPLKILMSESLGYSGYIFAVSCVVKSLAAACLEYWWHCHDIPWIVRDIPMNCVVGPSNESDELLAHGVITVIKHWWNQVIPPRLPSAWPWPTCQGGSWRYMGDLSNTLRHVMVDFTKKKLLDFISFHSKMGCLINRTWFISPKIGSWPRNVCQLGDGEASEHTWEFKP